MAILPPEVSIGASLFRQRNQRRVGEGENTGSQWQIECGGKNKEQVSLKGGTNVRKIVKNGVFGSVCKIVGVKKVKSDNSIWSS